MESKKTTAVIFGATIESVLLCVKLSKEGNGAVIFENDINKQSMTFYGYDCIRPDYKLCGEKVFICVHRDKSAREIQQQLQSHGIQNGVVISEKEQLKLVEEADDREYLEIVWEFKMGYKLALDDPRTFNEKLQWLKLYNRKDIQTKMVDKVMVKDYVSEKVGSEYVIPLLGTWDKFDDINFDVLPEQFVLKCTHDSGSVTICRSKKKLDIDSLKEKYTKAMATDYSIYSREWPYKNVKHRIMAEKYLEDENSKVLVVYKFMCFNGVPRIIQVIQDDKTENETIDYFDTDWNLLEMLQIFPNSKVHLPKPDSLSEMLNLCRKLAEGQIFVRVDFYEVKGRPFFSEFTFYSDAGYGKFEPDFWDETLGKWIMLKQA